MQNMMDTMDIAFPHLGIYLRNVPKTITIGNFSIALYGIVIAIGMLCGIWLASRIAKKTGQNPDTYWDISIWLIIFSIIGARVYYVIFFWDAYKDDPIQIFNLRGGGLAIYGGVIAGVLAVYFVSRRKKIPFPAMLDCLCYGLLLGQIIGRWGNFMNREAFGAETTVFCRMGLTAPDGATVYVHPTFLYESLWNLGVLLFLLWFDEAGKRRFDGHCITLYFLLYGLGRFWIEGLRTDSLYIGGSGIRVSQALSLALVLASAALLLYKHSQPFSPGDLYVNRVAAHEAAVIIEKTEES